MPSRVSLPGADLLFGSPEPAPPAREQPPPSRPTRPARRPSRPARPAGRPRHEEKITFYCTEADLTRLEETRLSLRSGHHLAADRGRIIRAALDEVLHDFETRGEDSALVRRLLAD